MQQLEYRLTISTIAKFAIKKFQIIKIIALRIFQIFCIFWIAQYIRFQRDWVLN